MTRLLEPAPQANLVWIDRVSSTNDVAEAIMAAFTEDDQTLADTVIIAGEQTRGQGRGANSWASPRGGLYATWMGWLPADVLGMLPVAAGLACARAVELAVPGLRVGLKWPNDLYVNGGKLGGVLCHARSGSGDAWVRVGFGINIATVPSLAPGDPVRPTSLAELGWAGEARSTAVALVGRFIQELPVALGSDGASRSEWISRSIHAPGDRLRLRLDHALVEGCFLGFAPDGSLELDVAGQTHRFASGELVLPLVPMGG